MILHSYEVVQNMAQTYNFDDFEHLKHIILFLFSIKPNNDIGFDFSLYSLLSINLVKYTNDSSHVG